jgi:hypothetical protein
MASVSAFVDEGPVFRSRAAHRRRLAEGLWITLAQFQPEERVHAGMATEPAVQVEARSSQSRSGSSSVSGGVVATEAVHRKVASAR